MYNAFAVVLKWLDYAVNVLYNSVDLCRCGGLVMVKYDNTCVICGKKRY